MDALAASIILAVNSATGCSSCMILDSTVFWIHRDLNLSQSALFKAHLWVGHLIGLLRTSELQVCDRCHECQCQLSIESPRIHLDHRMTDQLPTVLQRQGCMFRKHILSSVRIFSRRLPLESSFQQPQNWAVSIKVSQ